MNKELLFMLNNIIVELGNRGIDNVYDTYILNSIMIYIDPYIKDIQEEMKNTSLEEVTEISKEFQKKITSTEIYKIWLNMKIELEQQMLEKEEH